jgi:toxin ParE1/3/4
MYKLAELAAEDFAGIYEYSLLNFGLQQAEHFTENLESALLLLSESPLLGRDASNILVGVQRHEFESH